MVIKGVYHIRQVINIVTGYQLVDIETKQVINKQSGYQSVHGGGKGWWSPEVEGPTVHVVVPMMGTDRVPHEFPLCHEA